MNLNQSKLRTFVVSTLLAFATAFGSFITLSVSESCKSEESKVELTELVQSEIDGEAKIVEERARLVRLRSVAARGPDNGLRLLPSSLAVASLAPPQRNCHNGCGSHLRI